MGGGAAGPGGIVARRRAMLDDADEHPRLRVSDEPSGRHRRLLAAKQRADEVVADTSAELAATIEGTRPGRALSSMFAARQPAMSRLTVVLVLVALVLAGPRLFGALMAGMAGGAGLFILAVLVGGGLYVAGNRLFAGRRAEISGRYAASVIAQLEADARRRLRSIIDEWFRIDDVLGIGTALESAYSREPRSPELDRARQSIIASIDDAMDDGHRALAALGDGSGGEVGAAPAGPVDPADPADPAGRAHLADRLRRVDAADHAFLRLRFYRRALDD